MEFAELENGSILEIRADAEDKARIQAIMDNGTDNGDSDILCRTATEWDFFESYLCNTEYNWVSADMTGDLTDAPMLGRLDEDGEVSHRWAFMDYQIKSLLEELLEHGKVQFVGGSLTETN